jgi:FAD:protein FMN transferase
MGKKSLLRCIFNGDVRWGAAAIIPCVILLSCIPNKTTRQFFALDTLIEITLFSSGHPVNADLDSLQVLFATFDTAMSISNPASMVYKTNHRNDSLVVVSGLLKEILLTCRSEWQESNHLFDITVAPLKYLYGLESHSRINHVPTQRELDSVKMYVGFDKIVFITDSTIVLPHGLNLDFGGIGKGFVLRAAADFLKKKGYSSFLINTGGDLVAFGTKPGNDPWRIGIQDPRNTQEVIAQLPVTDSYVFTSGDYERFFIDDSVRYHHLFDPRTCIPGR